MWIFEPRVAERVFEDLVHEHQIPVHRNEWLDRENGVRKIECPNLDNHDVERPDVRRGCSSTRPTRAT